MSYAVAIYERRQSDGFRSWSTLGLGDNNLVETASDASLLKERVIAALQRELPKFPPRLLARLSRSPRLRLERIRLHLTVGARTWVGLFPLILEEVPDGLGGALTLAYHPALAGTFTPDPTDADPRALAARYRAFLEHALDRLASGPDGAASDDELELEDYTSDRKDRVRVIPFIGTVPTLLERLAPTRSPFDDLRPAAAERDDSPELPRLAVCLSQRASEALLLDDQAIAREPYKGLLFALAERGPVVVVGPPGAGKTTLIHGWVRDRLLADGYLSHRSLESTRRCHELSGRRILAGMKHFGEWEERVARILAELTAQRGALVVPDLAQWARLGRTRDSERNLAEVFRGPLERGEVSIVGECHPEAWALLEEEAPAFTQRFQVLHLPAATRELTVQVLLGRVRQLELRDYSIDESAIDACIEGAELVFPGRVDPGRSLALLEAAVQDETHIDAYEVYWSMSQRSGVPQELLHSWGEQDTKQAVARAIFGQPGPVAAIGDLLDTLQARLSDPQRPWGVFLLSGPTGTGKTELAKAVAAALFGSAERLLRIDMSELSGPDAPERLLGAAHPLTSGGGLLTEPVLEQPFQVILLDELEKAHPSVLYLLLQLLEDGRLTDARGRTADYRRAVILMTTNLGAERVRPSGFGTDTPDPQRQATSAIEAAFPPELVNRIDRILGFSPLPRAAAAAIAHRQLTALASRPGLRDRQALVEFDPALVELVVDRGFDPAMGGRTVKRWIEGHIVDPLATLLATSDRRTVQAIRLGVHNDEPSVTASAIAPHPETHHLPRVGEDSRLLEARIESARRDLAELPPIALSGDIDPEVADRLHFIELYRGRLLQARRRLLALRSDRRARPLDHVAAEAEVHFLLTVGPLIESPIHRATVVLARPRAVLYEACLLPALVTTLSRHFEAEDGAFLEAGRLVRSKGLPSDASRVEAVALRLSGLGLLPALVPELGTHLLQSIGQPLEAVILSVSERDPLDALADLSNFERNDHAEGPHHIPAYVRRIWFAPGHHRQARQFRIEEPATSTLVEGFAADLVDLVSERVLLNRGRRPGAAAGPTARPGAGATPESPEEHDGQL